jgi:hypothetical protein
MNCLKPLLVTLLCVCPVVGNAASQQTPAEPPSFKISPKQKAYVVPAELKATETEDPRKELERAIQGKKLCFLGIGGLALRIPGIAGGGVNTLVEEVSYHVIDGTNELRQTPEQSRLQPAAWKYAERYNLLLVQHLVSTNHPAILHARTATEAELARFATRDPLVDAQGAIKRNEAKLLMLDGVSPAGLGLKSGTAGYDFTPLSLIDEAMTTEQKARLAHVITRYIIPYNQYILAHQKPDPALL